MVMAAIFVTALSMFYVAKANPSFFIRAQSSTATSTVTSVNPTNSVFATTTLVYDTGVATAGSTDRATLAVQYTGSSTLSAMNIALEYSQDGIDWYGDRLSNHGTSTVAESLVQTTSYVMGFSSTTQGGALGTTGRTTRLIDVPTPTRYVRAIFTNVPGALFGSYWAEFVGKRQNP